MTILNRVCLVLLVLSSIKCDDKARTQGHDFLFQENCSLDDLHAKAKYISQNNDVTIGYYSGSALWDGPFVIKAFAFKDKIWRKIELRTNIWEFDSSDSLKQVTDMIQKEIILTKECSNTESDFFVAQIVKQNLFTLDEEQQLIKKSGTTCTETLRRRKDAGWVVFWIASGSKVRKLKYDYPYLRIKDCPEMEEWKNIVAVQDLFENEWFIKKH